MDMKKPGLGRFEYWLVKLDEKLEKAKESQSPALWLYQNDGRTILFMLEELAQLYAQIHNPGRFGKTRKRFKELEDLIGQVDYYDAFAKEFLEDPLMPVTVRMAMEKRREEVLAGLNTLLIKRGWLNGSRTAKIRRRLRKLDWVSAEKETAAISTIYQKSAASITEFFRKVGPAFTDVEDQLHALRRKIRRLSIYPQALQGAIQFSERQDVKPYLHKYMEPAIVHSKFNVMPDAGNNEVILLLSKPHYLAMSWLIAKLGSLKDKGLRIVAATEGFEQSQFVSAEVALQMVYERTDERMEKILEEAMQICRTFFEEGNLERLLAVSTKNAEEVVLEAQ